MLAVILVILASPLLVLLASFVRALILALPAMWLLSMAHDVIPVIPAWDFWQTMLVLMLLGIFIPTGTNSSSD